jgi:hypothetical protein
MNIPPFYIGRKVVCIKDHSRGAVKKGQEYIIKDIIPGCCEEDSWWVDVGYKAPENLRFVTCPNCNNIGTKNIGYIAYYLFAPIEEQQFSKVTYTEILEAVEMCNN